LGPEGKKASQGVTTRILMRFFVVKLQRGGVAKGEVGDVGKKIT